jgi:GxxExxY protein
MELNHITSKIIKAAINVHKELGPGLLESAYQVCLEIELPDMGFTVASEIPLPVVYKGKEIKKEGFRIDLLVENLLIVELKLVEKVQPVHKKQLLTYLQLAEKPLGLLINFDEVLLKDGITRIINTTDEKSLTEIAGSQRGYNFI